MSDLVVRLEVWKGPWAVDDPDANFSLGALCRYALVCG